MDFIAKKLSADDVAEFRDVIVCFGNEFREPETYIENQPSDQYLSELLASSNFIALSATANGKVIGGLAAYELKKFEQARSEIYIYDLAVAQSSRRKGVSTALIETLKSIAIQRGAWVIFVQADYEDEPAIKLYSKLGTREEVLHFDISI